MAKFFTPTRLSENIRKTPEGYLLCLDVPIARTGWQEYGPGETPLEVGDDGRVWIHREADEVFRAQTIASFNGKSVTVKHPQDFVDPSNWKMLTHGVAQNVRRGDEKDEDDEEMLLADLLVTDELAIGLIENGLREVSCGYDAEYEQTGEGEGRQYNIVGNHIALVEQGRAGSTYAIKDHKGKVTDMDLKELAASLAKLGKTLDGAIAKKAALDKKKAKTEDEGDATPEQVTYDDIKKCIQDLSGKLDSMMESKSGDEEKPAEKKEMPEDEDMEDSDEGEESGQNSRLEKLEAAVAKILKVIGKGGEDEEEESEEDMSGEDEDMEESEDEEEESESEDEEGEEAEESQKKKTGDSGAFEILTPGQSYKGKSARLECLKVFAKTKDGAKVLKKLGMAKPVIDSKSNVDMLFLAATALVKSERGTGLQGTKDSTKWKDLDLENTSSVGKSAEDLNEINAKHYGAAK